jgi:hypothetical protein
LAEKYILEDVLLDAAPGGEKYETPEWILQGYAWKTLPVMDKVHEDLNKEFDTNSKFPL